MKEKRFQAFKSSGLADGGRTHEGGADESGTHRGGDNGCCGDRRCGADDSGIDSQLDAPQSVTRDWAGQYKIADREFKRLGDRVVKSLFTQELYETMRNESAQRPNEGATTKPGE